MNDNALLEVAKYLDKLQLSIITALKKFETEEFVERSWESKLGFGKGYIVEQGKVFERAGISKSEISADKLPTTATVRNPQLANKPYQATGVSLVLHPLNPFVPTVHMNVRFFCTEGAWWFGGGMDLTPYYGFEKDCVHFHQTCKSKLDSIDEKLYPEFKSNCDEYFFIKHRQQARGIGGVFFDDFKGDSFEQAFTVMQAVGDGFELAYIPIVEKRLNTKYTDEHCAHQLFRRGRYVEFNLVQDRGTLFGLQSGGQADAILMSMPPTVAWDSLAKQRNEKDDKQLVENFLKARDWANS